MQEDEKQRINRELIELLNELRVLLPAVQMLFAFMLILPFTGAFGRTSEIQRLVYFSAFLCATAATGLLIAPSAYHRLLFRQGQGPASVGRQPAGHRRHRVPGAGHDRRDLRRDERPVYRGVGRRSRRGQRGMAGLAVVRLGPPAAAEGNAAQQRLRQLPSSPAGTRGTNGTATGCDHEEGVCREGPLRPKGSR